VVALWSRCAQAYGSITEDYNSAMTLMSAGFATMFLNERLSFGMAPDLIQDVMTQRLRWAMGALQVGDPPCLRSVACMLCCAALCCAVLAPHFGPPRRGPAQHNTAQRFSLCGSLEATGC
jgi:hypothetical protein